jgi:hypothetical protein
VASIATGADANAYICSTPPTLSFVPSASAAMVVTSVPTQYVRVYCPECSPPSFPNRSFMADPGTIRGLTPAQIKDVLALPNLPSMITIVTVPAGTCVLVGQGAAVPGFGNGGTAQEYAAGTPSGANCQGLQFLPETDYINRQAIGALALLYGPRAGGGNAGAVAAALDHGPFPAPFTDMDLITRASISSISAIRRRCAPRWCNSTARSMRISHRSRSGRANSSSARCVTGRAPRPR